MRECEDVRRPRGGKVVEEELESAIREQKEERERESTCV